MKLSQHGVLWSWTVQRFPPPSPPYIARGNDFDPFGLGYVELADEVIVESILTESDAAKLRIGMPMELTRMEVPTATGGQAMTFAFAPVEQD
ncbi:Zn-ribbon domain-containing OB-fold protein [Mycolicibacterium sp. XJ870]